MKQLDHQEIFFKEKKFPIILILDSITGPANVGSIFRLADAFNVEKILICGAGFQDLSSSRLRRTARSTVQNVAFELVEDPVQSCKQLNQDGYTLIALEITSDSKPVEGLQYNAFSKIALVVGNERTGIGEALLTMAKEKVHVTMFGKNSSMNVSQATGIALFEITKSLQPI